MSYIFDANDKVIWSPALRVGKLYVGLADTLSGLISVPHGLSRMASDYYEVERDLFRTFIEALMKEYSGGHRIARSLLGNFILTSLVLLDRMGGGISTRLDEGEVAAMKELSAAMPEL